MILTKKKAVDAINNIVAEVPKLATQILEKKSQQYTYICEFHDGAYFEIVLNDCQEIKNYRSGDFHRWILKDFVTFINSDLFAGGLQVISPVSSETLIEFLVEKFENQSGRDSRIGSFLSLLPNELLWKNQKGFEDFEGRSLINACPTNKNILLIPLNIEEEVTQTGIIKVHKEQDNLINKNTDTANFFGMIVSAAPDAYWFGETPFNIGDIVIYAKHRETHVEFGGQNLLMISQHDVWAVVPDNAYYDFQFTATGDIYQNIRYKLTKNEDIIKREQEAAKK